VQKQSIASVSGGEGGLDAVTVFEEALVEFACDAGVEGAGGAAENVDVALWHLGAPADQDLRQKGSNCIGGWRCIGILRYAQDDSKNEQRQEQRRQQQKNEQRQE
jgi:hypothetical protein